MLVSYSYLIGVLVLLICSFVGRICLIFTWMFELMRLCHFVVVFDDRV